MKTYSPKKWYLSVKKVTCLAGGVGAARFLQGLIQIISSENLTVIVNTGDDMVLYGLNISPDIDIVTYTLAGIVDEEKGWGIKNDTFGFLEQMARYGYDTWFGLGDRDLATHIDRTMLLRQGCTLSEITEQHSQTLGLKTKILPMTDQKFETHIKTDNGLMHFEEYLVKYRSEPNVSGVEFIGLDTAKPAPGVVEAIEKADAIILPPSNPIVSIGTILSFKEIREALISTDAPVGGISPIIGGAPVKGPADRLMQGLGVEVSAYGVASIYRDFIDDFVIDNVDSGEADRIRELGVDVTVTNTIMRTLKDKEELAKTVMSVLER
jgi:LPPG:FO 2-phospho-L-lactate transferase